MALHTPQPDDNQLIQRLFAWIPQNSIYAVLYPDPELPLARFMPSDALKKYFGDNGCRNLNDILAALFPPPEVPPVFPDQIRQNYPAVFCILLRIGKGRYIGHFTRNNISDHRLPLDPTQAPANFPTSTEDDSFFKRFCDEQWKYCAPKLHYHMMDTSFEENRILPITFMKELGRGASAKLYQIDIHPAYRDGFPNDQTAESSDQSANKSLVLKQYIGGDAEKNYNAEITAFRKIEVAESEKIRPTSSLIGFYGSYRHGNSFNVLLEFADMGHLEKFMQDQSPPRNAEDIIKVWEHQFMIREALMRIHEVEPWHSSDGQPVFQGWHQDIKHTNILVASDGAKPPYDWKFKLADLGSSHFKPYQLSAGGSVATDNRGTRTYGAPECYRSDDVIARINLKVTQRVDIWSLGGIYSEFARWLAHGYPGVLDYRAERRFETSQISNFGDGDCFHDGHKVLKAVRISDVKTRQGLCKTDFITEVVMQRMIKDMLGPVEGRPTATQLWSKSQEILGEARERLAETESAIEFLPGPFTSSRTFNRPPLPPVLPPEISRRSQTSFQIPREGAGEWQRHVSELNDTRQGHDWEEEGREVTTVHRAEIPGMSGSRYVEPQIRPRRTNSSSRPQQSTNSVSESGADIPGISAYNGSHTRPRRTGSSSRPTQLPNSVSRNEGGHSTARLASYRSNDRTHQQHEIFNDTDDSNRSNSRHSAPTPRPGATGIAPGTSHRQVLSADGSLGSQLHNVGHRHDASLSETSPPRHSRNVMVEEEDGISHRSSSFEPPFSSPTAARVRRETSPKRDSHVSPGRGPPNIPTSSNDGVTTGNDEIPFMSIGEALLWKQRKKSGRQNSLLPDNGLRSRLNARDHVFLVDDSLSMSFHWLEVKRVFEALSYLVKDCDPDGTELYFANSGDQRKSRNTTSLLEMLEHRKLQGTTDISLRLTQIFGRYKDELDRTTRSASSPPWTLWKRGTTQPNSARPLSLYILTDGAWESQCDADTPIKLLVEELISRKMGKLQVGIQFISFGNDKRSLDRLERLDSGLGLGLDIVDTTPSTGNIWKMLLGAINTTFDGYDPRQSSAPISPTSQNNYG